MYLMMLVGTLVSALILEQLLQPFSAMRLIQVIQGAALFTIVVNAFALWKQEARQRGVVEYKKGERRPQFREAWRTFTAGGQAVGLLVATGLGFFAFNLQDVLLEPYGGEILHFTVAGTTALTGIMAFGAVLAFVWSATQDRTVKAPLRLASQGVVVGLLGFAMITSASMMSRNPIWAPFFFRFGVMLIGFGEGLFGVGTLSFAMGMRDATQHGIALGAWGAVFATAEGLSFALSGLMKDALSHLGATHAVGSWMAQPAAPYTAVYGTEIVVLLITLVVLGTVGRRAAGQVSVGVARPFGLADIPA
jgi:BCD family chlorophyll transporter-like MFS transporter